MLGVVNTHLFGVDATKIAPVSTCGNRLDQAIRRGYGPALAGRCAR